MIRFDCDYLEGAHPKILKKIVETNYEQTAGYSKDEYTKSAIGKIKKTLKREDVDIHILTGGTQTNMTVISSILRPYQSVICVDTGHINVHETGAIESFGNKIITVENEEGRISAKQIEDTVKYYIEDDAPEHMVMPKLVFISLPTECGTNYTKEELTEIYNTCKKYDLYLYIDGARLGYGLVAKDTDLKIEDIPNLCDVFYIGGTKCGALFGEAVVIVNENLKKDFRYYIKQRGALLAKGRMLGIQFDALFEKELYFKIAKQAVDLAIKIKEAAINKGYKLLYNSFTNQQFIIFPNDKLKKLEKEFVFFKWKKIDEDNTAVRICTSWATTEENVDKLIQKM
jgi:threonine aldolase